MKRASIALLALVVLGFYGPASAAAEMNPDDPTAGNSQAGLASQFPPLFDDGGACTGVPDTLPGIFDFTAACERHDACYAEGGDRLACDLAFREDMIAQCEAQHPDVFEPRRYACLGFAELYFIGVRLFGQFVSG